MTNPQDMALQKSKSAAQEPRRRNNICNQELATILVVIVIVLSVLLGLYLASIYDPNNPRGQTGCFPSCLCCKKRTR